MQITVTISDEFAEHVKARGLTPEGYVENLIAEQAAAPPLAQDTATRLADFERFFKEMAANSDKIPVLSEEALTRESFYQDHD
jgi:hypothetical protein